MKPQGLSLVRKRIARVAAYFTIISLFSEKNTKVYSCGGYRAGNTLYVYDLKTRAVTTVKLTKPILEGSEGIVFDGVLYSIGEFNELNYHTVLSKTTY